MYDAARIEAVESHPCPSSFSIEFDGAAYPFRGSEGAGRIKSTTWSSRRTCFRIVRWRRSDSRFEKTYMASTWQTRLPLRRAGVTWTCGRPTEVGSRVKVSPHLLFHGGATHHDRRPKT